MEDAQSAVSVAADRTMTHMYGEGKRSDRNRDGEVNGFAVTMSRQGPHSLRGLGKKVARGHLESGREEELIGTKGDNQNNSLRDRE